MRPIKFRAWDLEHKEMTKVDYVDFISGIVGLSDKNVTDYEQHIYWVNIMQYTGLKDKNDVEIYEGDILLGHSVYPEFDLFESKLLGEVYYSSRGTWDCYSYILGGFNDQVEVIGNVYEDPELLEEQNK